MKLYWKKTVGFIMLLLLDLLLVIIWHKNTSMVHIDAIKDWCGNYNYSYMSAYTDRKLGILAEEIEDLHYKLKTETKSRVQEYENVALTNYAFSEDCKMGIYTERDIINEGQFLAVGGDFFAFHPLELESGRVFREDELMMDSVILDSNSALRLFGSFDIVGKTVYVEDIPFRVVGVYSVENSRLGNLSGAAKGYIYIPYSQAVRLKKTEGITGIDLLAASPLSNTGKELITPLLQGLTKDENQIEIVDNNERLSIVKIFKVLVAGDTRVMVKKPLIYPFYENENRAVENRLAIVLVALIMTNTVIITILVLFLYRLSKAAGFNRSGLLEYWSELLDYLKKFVKSIDRKPSMK